MNTGPVVLKLGGELIESPSWLEGVVAAIAAVVNGVTAAAGVAPERHGAARSARVAGNDGEMERSAPLIVVHGGGREIDAALKTAGIERRQVDGLRVTDAATLDVVVAVLAGTVNTRLVAALNAAGVPAVGLTGADARCGVANRAAAHRSVDGRTVNLGRVGVPSDRSDSRLLTALLRDGFVPVIASIGAGETAELLNVNADVFAADVASRLGARRLIVAGTTAGVLDDDGKTLRLLESSAMTEMVTSGAATAGMIAKLRACADALAGGVDDVLIVDGRDGSAIEGAAAGGVPAAATRLML